MRWPRARRRPGGRFLHAASTVYTQWRHEAFSLTTGNGPIIRTAVRDVHRAAAPTMGASPSQRIEQPDREPRQLDERHLHHSQDRRGDGAGPQGASRARAASLAGDGQRRLRHSRRDCPVDRRHVDPPRRAGRAGHAVGHLHGRRRDMRPVRDVPGPDPAGPDVAQPLARPGLRPGQDHRRSSLGRVLGDLAARRPRRADDHRLRDGCRRLARRRVPDAARVVPICPLVGHRSRACSSIVGIRSVRAVRSHASYETWYAIHLFTYLAIALAFLHQLFVGVDFTTDHVARPYWIGLYAVAFGTLRSSASASRSRSRGGTDSTSPTSSRRRPGSPRSISTGRELDQLPVRAGQWFRLRFLTPRRLVPGPSVLHLGRAERQVPPLHDQGARRLHQDAAANPRRDARLRRGPVRSPDRARPGPRPGSC